jgi:hypothetical protein
MLFSCVVFSVHVKKPPVKRLGKKIPAYSRHLEKGCVRELKERTPKRQSKKGPSQQRYKHGVFMAYNRGDYCQLSNT